jgi:hypothetical protein
MRRAVVDPFGVSWVLELRDSGFGGLHQHFLTSMFLRLIGRTPTWQARLIDATGTEAASFESRDPSAAREWVKSMADRIEAGSPLV